LAIAAEARVPVAEVKPQELEAGLWVGQCASKVRELFQTARVLVDLNALCFQFSLSICLRRILFASKSSFVIFLPCLGHEKDFISYQSS